MFKNKGYSDDMNKTLTPFYKYLLPKQRLVIFLAVIEYTLLSVITFCLQYFIELGIAEEYEKLYKLLFYNFIIIIVYVVLYLLGTYFWKNLISDGFAFLKKLMFKNILDSSYLFHMENNTGDLFSKITSDAYLFSQGISIFKPMIITNLFRIIVVIVPLTYISVKLTLIVLISIPIYYAIYFTLNKKIREVTVDERASWSKLSIDIKEKFSSFMTIKIYNKENYFSKKFDEKTDEFFRLSKRLNLVSATGMVLSGSMVIVMPLLILLYGFVQVSNGHINVGQLISFYAFVPFLIEPMSNLTDVFLGRSRAMEIATKVENLILPPKQELCEEISDIENIDFKDLSLSFGDNDVISNFDYSLKSGSRVAIVGESGAGKSSLVKLMLKLYHPTDGEIIVNDINLAEVCTKSLYSKLSYMPQDAFIFEDTIKNNICLGDDYTDQEVLDIIEMCQLNDFLNNQPNGLNEVLSESGKMMSGGERQRLSLARALIRNRKMIVMDEPTSSVDEISELRIVEALENYLKQHPDKIVIVITHKKKLIDICSDILMFDNRGITLLKPESYNG